MTISSSTGRIQYTGNAATTDFATNFKLLDEDHVQVFLDGTLKTISTDYTVSGVGDSTATIAFNSAPGSGAVITLRLSVPLTQEFDLVNGNEFDADTIEQALDLGVQIDQALNEELNRTIKAPTDASTSFDGTLPSLTANYIIRVNADSTGFEAVNGTDVITGTFGTLSTQDADSIAVTGGTISGITSLGVSGDITVTGTVDGVDIAALKTDVDGFPDALKNLTAAEVGELENIGLTTISAAQWGYLGAMTGQPIEITELSEDTSPVLAGDLDVDGNSIVSSSNGDINITPNGTGNVSLGNFTFNADQTVGAGQDDYVLRYDDASGTIGLEADTGGGGGIANVVDDTTPQLGGQLDVNGNAIGDGTNELLTFTEDASAVNHVNIENEATGSGPIISAAGDDTNIDLNLAAKGTGDITLGNFTFDADQTVGAGQDNYVLTYDDAGGKIALEAAAGGGGGGGSWEFISSTTASSSASVEFTGISSTYNSYIVVVTQAEPSSGTSVSLELTVSTNNGSSYLATNYRRTSSNFTLADLGFGANTGATSSGFTGQVVLGNLTANGPTTIRSNMVILTGSNSFTESNQEFIRTADEVIDAIKFEMTSGNIAEGIFTLYGLKES